MGGLGSVHTLMGWVKKNGPVHLCVYYTSVDRNALKQSKSVRIRQLAI